LVIAADDNLTSRLVDLRLRGYMTVGRSVIVIVLFAITGLSAGQARAETPPDAKPVQTRVVVDRFTGLSIDRFKTLVSEALPPRRSRWPRPTWV
jgi:hypothetical protein